MSAFGGKADIADVPRCPAYDPKRTSLRLSLLREGCSYLVGKSLLSIIKTWWVPGSGDCAFEQNSSETFSLRWRNRWPTAFLPLEEDGGLRGSGIE